MTETDDANELLFFDTFSHEVDSDINLDLVQFPKPVYITQIRIIPLGARVQADFPGGVRLGATNPSTFDIEFFVNDLGIQNAPTFENLGHLKYNQNDCIHLECGLNKIATDGLVLRGWYSTITLAVYGITRTAIADPIASPPPQPLDAIAMEDICEISAENRDSIPVDEEWKEPLVVDILHKSRVSDYERDDVEYAEGVSRDHYHHSGDERERRLRKGSPRHRTLSESTEREYVRSRSDRERDRDKTGREWSRSPEYSRRSRRKRSERSRSDVEDSHKWPPRTPPASIDSPVRPRSPDILLEYTEDEMEHDMRYKLKARAYMRSRESLGDSTTIPDAHTIEDDDTPDTPVEQFEPILSDDEILGDDDSTDVAEQVAAEEFEAELQAAATAAEPAIQKFDPYQMPVLKHIGVSNIQCNKELENLQMIFKKFELQSKCYSLEVFITTMTSVDERENFVFLCEQLINQLSYLSHDFKLRNLVLQQFYKSESKQLQLTFDILRIALDFEVANSQTQPAFKTRHIKAGARLMELLGGCPEFIAFLLNKESFNPFDALFKLYKTEYMALSIKLMLLKAVYALLDTKKGLQYFLSSSVQGYQLILETLKQSPLTRTKFALTAIIQKLNLYEALNYIRESSTKLFVSSNINLDTQDSFSIKRAIEQINEAVSSQGASYKQPRRFLPVSKKFEIVVDAAAQRSFTNALQTFFKHNFLAESIMLLLSADLAVDQKLHCVELLRTLVKSEVGMNYLIDDAFPATEMLISILLGSKAVPDVSSVPEKEHVLKEEIKSEKESVNVKTETETKNEDNKLAISKSPPQILDTESKTQTNGDAVSNENSAASESAETLAEKDIATVEKHIENSMEQLGIELAFKVQTRYHLDAIEYITTATKEFDPVQLTEHLHSLYSLTCDAIGRAHVIDVLCINNNLQIFIELIKKERRLQAQHQHSTKYKSPVFMYTVDLIDCCVRNSENLGYLIEHGVEILELAKNHESFEPSVAAVLQEMYVYLKPLEAIQIFAYDDITPLVEVINRSIEYITTFPGDLIMGLRILRHLAIGPTNANTEELKYRFVTLQFYAADGVQILFQILERLYTFFEQPGLHKPALCSLQGTYCCQMVLPTLEILRRMLSYAIQTRDVDFKDLTAIDHLMKTYFLIYHFPADCAVAASAEAAKKEIILMLLAYTQPHEQDEELLHKSLWTQMIREVLKNIDAPHTLLPGLSVLAELLPLPLPIPLPRDKRIDSSYLQRLITERTLWSAHLHPQSTQIARLIETVAPASFPQLSDLFVRVCLQLADLAPNMTLLISKTFSELMCTEWISSSGGNVATQQLCRLLNFFARLTKHATLKSSALSILCGKLWELFQAILSLKEPRKPVDLKCQISIHEILKSFLDTEISLISPEATTAPEINLASALPPKELIPRIADALLTNLFTCQLNETHEALTACLCNLTMLTQNDITFYHLASQLKQRSGEFQNWMQRLIVNSETGTWNESIENLLVFLQSLIKVEDVRSSKIVIPSRTLKLGATELAHLIVIKDVQTQPLQRIRKLAEDQKQPDFVTNLIIKICDYMESVEENSVTTSTATTTTTMETDEDSSAPNLESQLPQAESIVMQYASRPVFGTYEQQDHAILSVRYWLEPLSVAAYSAEDFVQKFEHIPCDLNELANFIPDTNLSADCKRILHLSASPQSNRERTPTAPCFRTRRVEVEPSTGRPEKKLYITPVRGRGFSRAPPTRGDLFRSRPPNTSRPPSLHVDDFLALETCGAQPTGPTGYNKIPPILRGSRIRGNRGGRIITAMGYRKPKLIRTSSPSTWNDGSSVHYRAAATGESYPPSPHFGLRARGRGRARPYLR